MLQHEGHGLVELPENLVIPFEENSYSFECLVDFTFPEMQATEFDPYVFTRRAILTPKNDDVDSINRSLIEQFLGRSFVYKSFDRVAGDDCRNYPNEFLNTLCPGGMSPHEFILKENCPVILLRNLDPASGLCNSTCLVCK